MSDDQVRPKLILTDIEGTTTSLSYASETLFPYSFERMEKFVRSRKDDAEIAKILSTARAVLKEKGCPSQSLDDTIQGLRKWIRDDEKYSVLKTLQGLIWADGYEKGDLRKSHMYPDVRPALERWARQNIELAVFSSGSTLAQRVIFQFSVVGDLTTYIAHYFDTRVGKKTEATSYRKIVDQFEIQPSRTLFLSDVIDELEAASACGMQTIQLVRNDEDRGSHPRTASSFDEIVV